MKKVAASLLTAAALALTARVTLAQIPNQAGLNASMLKLFGSTSAFSSRADVRMLDKAGQETMSLSMNFALLEGKIRLEVDLNQLKSKDLTPAMMGPLKQMGMDKLVSIVRTDKKLTLVVYPALQSYAEMPMSPEEAAGVDKNYKTETTPLSKETIDGHPCQKNKVTISDGKGAHDDALVWNAGDLKEFPLQIQMNQPEATVVMRFKGVQLAKPAAGQFEVPAGYTKYDGMEKLMQGAMIKMLGGK